MFVAASLIWKNPAFSPGHRGALGKQRRLGFESPAAEPLRGVHGQTTKKITTSSLATSRH